MNDCRAEILDVVDFRFRCDAARLVRTDPQLEPESLRAGFDRFLRVLGRVLGSAKDIHEVEGLVDIRKRLDARHAEHLVAVRRAHRDHAVTLGEEVAHDPVTGPRRIRRSADEGDRLRFTKDLLGAPHAASLTRRRASGAVQRNAESVKPAISSVEGAKRPATTAVSAYPTGTRAKEPKKSRLLTRANLLSGTNCIISVFQTPSPKPMHRPRQSTKKRPSSNSCVSAIATTKTSLRANRRYMITTRCPPGFTCPKTRLPIAIPSDWRVNSAP